MTRRKEAALCGVVSHVRPTSSAAFKNRPRAVLTNYASFLGGLWRTDPGLYTGKGGNKVSFEVI